MNNHTLLRFSFTIAEAIASLPIASANIQGRSNAPKNIWDYYAVENPDLESYYIYLTTYYVIS